MYWLLLYILISLQGSAVTMDQFGRPLRPSDGGVKNDATKNSDMGQLPGIMKKYQPQAKHMKIKKLLRRLGGEFDVEWMSITRPNPISDSPAADSGAKDTTVETHAVVQALMASRNMTIHDSNMKPLVEFLSTLSKCPVRFEWTDLGELFWPRFIKSGLCTSENSCSWPGGMTCMPGQLKAVQILRWRCKRKGGASKRKAVLRDRKYRRIKNKRSKKLACSWKTIPYHVPIDCSCSC